MVFDILTRPAARSVARPQALRHTAPAFDMPHFETMETRLLLAVSAAEFSQIRAAYPDLNLSSNMSAYNILDVAVDYQGNLQGSLADSSIAATGTTPNLIVLRTGVAQPPLRINSPLVINTNAAQYGAMIIVSLGPVPLTIDAQNNSRVLTIGSSATVSLAGLTLTNGLAKENYGGGIYNLGTLTITKSTITGNTASTTAAASSTATSYYSYGGGIYNEGTLTITDSKITGNTVSTHVAISISTSAFSCGGGIFNKGTLTVTGSEIAGNTASTTSGVSASMYYHSQYYAYGGGIGSNGGEMTVTDSEITGNTVTAAYTEFGGLGTSFVYQPYGGGIFSNCTATVTNSTIANNKAYNRTNVYGYGGGVANNGTLTVTYSTITGNTAADSGGGIGNKGTVTITNSTVTKNTASHGGGMANGEISYSGTTRMTVTDSTIAENTASNGGGIHNFRGSLTVTDVIITGNKSSHSGGGILNSSAGTALVLNSIVTSNSGGGIHNTGLLGVQNSVIAKHTFNTGISNDGAAVIANSTIIGNGTGIYNDGHRTIHIANTIVLDNSTDILNDYYTVPTGEYIAGAPVYLRVYGIVEGSNNLLRASQYLGVANSNLQNNLFYDSDKPLFVNAVNADYRLAAGSQAIDKGSNALATEAGMTSSSKDLAGNPRIVNGAIDIGAYEYQVATTPLPAPTGVAATGKNSTTITVSWTAVANANGYTIQYATNSGFTQNVGTLNTSGGSGTARSADITGLTAGTTYYVRVLATGTGSYSNSPYSTGTVSAATPATPLPAPTGVSVSTKNTSAITVSWNGVTNASGYVIQYATDSDFTQNVKTQSVLSGSIRSADVTGLTAGTLYYVRVQAMGTGAYADSVYSGSASATTEAPPITPLNAPGGVSASTKNTATITVNWTAVANANGYVIQYATNSGFSQNVKTQDVSGGSANSADVTGLAAGTTYYVRVLAVGTGAYANSVYSGSASATTAMAPPERPVSVSVADVTHDRVTVSWSAVAGATGYRVVWLVGSTVRGETTVPDGEMSAMIDGLSANTAYTFRVYTLKGGQESATYASASATTKKAPVVQEPTTTTKAVVGSAKAKASGISSIVLTWKAPAAKAVASDLDVVRYDVYDVASEAFLGSVAAGEAVKGVFTFTASGLQPNQSYSFRVVVVCEPKAGGVDIVSSKDVTVKAKTAKFVAPKAGKAVKGDVGLTSATVRWQEHAFADGGYVITWFDAKDKKMTNPLGSEEVEPGETSFVIDGLSAGAKYTYTVAAVNNAVGAASPSAVLKKSVTALKFTATKKPASVRSALTSESATLTWKATALPKTVTAGEVSYEVLYTTQKGLKPNATDDGWTKLDVPAGELTITLDGLDAGKTYYVFVRSIWSEDASVFSNSGVMTLKTPLPR